MAGRQVEQIDRLTGRQIYKRMGMQSGKQADRQTDYWTGSRQTDTDAHIKKYTDTNIYI